MIQSNITENVINIDHLSVGYGMHEVLAGIDADIKRGQFISILGPNGVGKTTLLRTLSRHLKKLGGRIFLNEKNIDSFTQKEFAKETAVVLTTGVNTELFTGFEFAAMGRYPHTDFIGRLSGPDKEKVMESLRLVHADNLAARPMNEMSDGERQKLFIARALCQEPKIIILDEPTAHLDLKHKMEVMQILRNSCREKNITIIASMHDVDLASRVSDQVALIKNGKVIAWGCPEEVLNAENIRELYGMDKVGYDRTLGTIEMRYSEFHPPEKKVFCVAGSGTGAVLYRSLAKAGFGISTGVLHRNDVDYHVANSMGISIVSAPAYEKITGDMLQKCNDMIMESDFVIDSGFGVADLNKPNLELVNSALKIGKTVYSLRKTGSMKDAGIHEAGKIITVVSDYEIVNALAGSNGSKAV